MPSTPNLLRRDAAEMDARYCRRNEDLERLRALERRTGRRIRIMRTNGEPLVECELKLEVWTAGDANFPGSALSEVYARVLLGPLYPFVPPQVEVTTPVFNPLVAPDGRVHFGFHWSLSFFLDTFIERLFNILAFEEAALALGPVVNAEASEWYEEARTRIPAAFPSDVLNQAHL